jgi:hypothetical protein
MRKSIKAALAAALMLAAVSAESQPANTIQTLNQLEPTLVFVGQLGEAIAVQIEAMKKFAEATPLLQGMTSPAAIEANGPKVRALIAEARAAVGRSDAMLVRIAAPDVSNGGVTPAERIAEIRGQNAKFIAMLADLEGFLIAAERNDRQAALKLLPRLMEGSFLLIDGNAALYSNRMAGYPSTQSTHQVLEIGVQLYRTMGEAGRAWIAAKFDVRGEEAAASLRSRLAQTAVRARAASREGRANLVRELNGFRAATARERSTGEEAATMARLRRSMAARETLFALGDELAGLAEAAAGIDRAALAAQPDPQLVGQLAALELRFQSSLVEQGQIASGKIQ